MKDWQQRVVEEEIELNKKIVKIQRFLQLPPSEDVNRDEVLLMIEQCKAMVHYSIALRKRIESWPKES